MTTRKHRMLIVGTGSIGERHVRCFQLTGRAVVSICEPQDSLRGEIGERYGIERRYSRLEDALGEPHDAALIAAPAHLHISLAQQAAEAELHLLIEKPLSTRLEGIDTLQKTAGQHGLVAAVAYVYRAHPALAAMRQAIASGQFGRALELVAVAGQHFPTYRPAYRDTYYRDRETGGGAIQDAMTHVLNAAEWLVGPVDRLSADAAHKKLEDVEVEDTVHMIARHDDVLASYSLNQHQAPNENTITVICERGTARFEGHRSRWSWMLDPEQPWQYPPSESIERDTLFIRQADAFLDAVERKAAPLCSLDEGLQTLRVCLATFAAVESGRWQDIAQRPGGKHR